MLLVRRAFALARTLLCVGAMAATLPGGSALAAGQRTPFVQEVTIATPDVIAVEVRDPEIVRGRIV
ncbi:hypothetical protein WDZ92_25945 [Nostoc sp. NIES-2111]